MSILGNLRSWKLPALVGFSIVLLFLAPVFGQEKTDPQAIEFPDGLGKTEFLKICSDCHSPDNVIGKGYSADVWSDLISTMVARGAQGSDEQLAAITDYLTANFGPPPKTINMNKVTVLNLRNWLHLTQKQAEAVVNYRRQNGDFQSIEDLRKVSNVDFGVFETHRDRLVF